MSHGLSLNLSDMGVENPYAFQSRTLHLMGGNSIFCKITPNY